MGIAVVENKPTMEVHENQSPSRPPIAAKLQQQTKSWKLSALPIALTSQWAFARYESGKKDWVAGHLKPTSLEDDKVPRGRAALDLYFLEDDGGTFKATIEYDPYFLVAVKRGYEAEAEEWLKRVPGGGVVKSCRRIEKEDLQMPDHFLGYRRTFLELRFEM